MTLKEKVESLGMKYWRGGSKERAYMQTIDFSKLDLSAIEEAAMQEDSRRARDRMIDAKKNITTSYIDLTDMTIGRSYYKGGKPAAKLADAIAAEIIKALA